MSSVEDAESAVHCGRDSEETRRCQFVTWPPFSQLMSERKGCLKVSKSTNLFVLCVQNQVTLLGPTGRFCLQCGRGTGERSFPPETKYETAQVSVEKLQTH